MAFRSTLKPAEILKKLTILTANKPACSRFRFILPSSGEYYKTWKMTAQKHFSSQKTKSVQPQSFGCRHVAPSLSTRITRPFSTTITATTTTEVEDEDIPDDLYRKIDVEVKGHDPEVLNSYEKFVSMTAKELDINIDKISTPPKVITRRTLLKSVHIFKKHRVQYEWRTHLKVFEFKYLTGSTADTFLEYIQRNLPEGVAMKVTRYQLERLPEHISSGVEEGSKTLT